MKSIILLSGHIRSMKALKKLYDAFFEKNKHHNIEIVYSTSKKNHYQISNDAENYMHFDEIHDLVIDEEYIISTFPNIKQTVLFDDIEQYKNLYINLMETAKKNLEAIDMNTITVDANLSRINVFLQTYESEINSSYHDYSFLARAIDEIAHIIFGIQYIKQNIDCDLIIISRPDVALFGFDIDIMTREGLNNLYTCETDDDNPFVCPGYFYGSPDLLCDVFNDKFSFGHNLNFILCAESQIGYNIVTNVSKDKRKFFDFKCCMLGFYKKQSNESDHVVKTLNKNISNISTINKKLNAYNIRYYICMTSDYITSYFDWFNNKRYLDLISESDMIYDICDYHTLSDDKSRFYLKIMNRNINTVSNIRNVTKFSEKNNIMMFLDDSTINEHNIINDIILNNNKTQLTIIDSMVDCKRPTDKTLQFVEKHSANIKKWYCKNIRICADSVIYDYIPMFFHDNVKKSVINILSQQSKKREALHFDLCTAYIAENIVFSDDLEIRTKFNNIISRFDFCEKNYTDFDYSDTNIRKLMNYKFCIPPVSLNRDQFLIWLCIVIGTIPIVFRENINHLSSKIYHDVPVLIIDNPNELTDDYLMQIYDTMRSTYYNYDILTKEYWLKGR